jgi:lauroyl/myristoyl acyltransferase
VIKKISYHVALYFSRWWGVWFFRTFSWFIATGYYFFFPWRVAHSYKFYKVLIPGKGFFYYLRCAWKQYHNFTNVYIHRFVHLSEGIIEFTKEGWQYLDDAVEKKTGAVVLMSHVGNWELAAQMLKRKGMPMMLYLGAKVKHKEQVESIQKRKLAEHGIKIVTTSVEGKSPFALLEGINFLRDGGIVFMSGDRLWGNQSFVIVNFLGHEVKIPDTPHLLALVTGAPLMTFFVYQKAFGKYHVCVSPGRKVVAPLRADRTRAVHESAQMYADELVEFVCKRPFEWHHFGPFLGRKIEKES